MELLSSFRMRHTETLRRDQDPVNHADPYRFPIAFRREAEALSFVKRLTSEDTPRLSASCSVTQPRQVIE